MREKIRKLFAQARSDPQYAKLAEDYSRLEKQLGEWSRGLTEEEQDVLWGFVCVSDAMNYRMLELLCEGYKMDP